MDREMDLRGLRPFGTWYLMQETRGLIGVSSALTGVYDELLDVWKDLTGDSAPGTLPKFHWRASAWEALRKETAIQDTGEPPCDVGEDARVWMQVHDDASRAVWWLVDVRRECVHICVM